MDVQVAPADRDSWPALVAVLGQPGEPSHCWCQFHRCQGDEWPGRTSEVNRAAMRELVEASAEPGLVAYADEQPVGWCSLGPLAQFGRMASSPFIAGVRPAGQHLDGRWAVTCFVVASEARGSGVAAQLLDGAVVHAGEAGAAAVEGYPVDLATSPPEAAERLYSGSLSTFLNRGFTEVARLGPHNALVELGLTHG
jgi:GNAT superfamily N-acetyltransferase